LHLVGFIIRIDHDARSPERQDENVYTPPVTINIYRLSIDWLTFVGTMLTSNLQTNGQHTSWLPLISPHSIPVLYLYTIFISPRTVVMSQLNKTGARKSTTHRNSTPGPSSWRSEIHVRILVRSPDERKCSNIWLGDLLIGMLKKQGVKTLNGFIWLKIQIKSGALWTQQGLSGFHRQACLKLSRRAQGKQY